MAKPKRKHHPPGAATAASGEAVLAELDARASELAQADATAAGPIWGAVHKLLLKAKANPVEAGRVIARRDADGLARLVRALRGEEPAPAEPEPAADPGRLVPPETLKKAMRAFRKRLKLIRLDHESKLGVGPMTGGRKADFDAILPPQEYGPEVWQALVVEGKLRDADQGFYMLAE